MGVSSGTPTRIPSSSEISHTSSPTGQAHSPSSNAHKITTLSRTRSMGQQCRPLYAPLVIDKADWEIIRGLCGLIKATIERMGISVENGPNQTIKVNAVGTRPSPALPSPPGMMLEIQLRFSASRPSERILRPSGAGTCCSQERHRSYFSRHFGSCKTRGYNVSDCSTPFRNRPSMSQTVQPPPYSPTNY